MGRGKKDEFGEAEYRHGALERLREAQTLLRSEQFAGSIYLAGRGVEGMLRALIWCSDWGIRERKQSLETGHDLRRLLTLVRNLGLLRAGGRDDEFEAMIEEVGRLWFNNMRFASSRVVETRWWRLGQVHRKRTFKQAAADYFEKSSAIIKRCEALCGR